MCDDEQLISFTCTVNCYFNESRLDGLRATLAGSNVIFRVKRVQLTVDFHNFPPNLPSKN